MILPRLSTDLNNISKLDNYPPDDLGMTPALLKARFDQSGNDIKAYINETLLPALESGSQGSSAVVDAALSDTSENAVQNKVVKAALDAQSVSISELTANKIAEISRKYFAGKKVSILGDSISTFEGYTYAGNRCRYPQNNLLIDVNDTYWMRAINSLGLVLGINESWAGSRVTWDGTTESTDIGVNKCLSSVTRIGHLDDNGVPDIILVYAGTNDIINSVTIGTFDTTSPASFSDATIAALDVTTFASAYRVMLIRLLKAHRTSKIVVLLPNYVNSGAYPSDVLDSYIEIVKTECDYFGVQYIDTRISGISVFNTGTYLTDGIHPNALGMQLMADTIIKGLVLLASTYPYLDYGGDTTSAATYFASSLSGRKATDNLWDYLKHKTSYYVSGNTWTNFSSILSLCFKVSSGDRIVSDAFQAPGVGLTYNGNTGGIAGTRVAWLNNGTLITTIAPATIYAEFYANGYITVPEGANEICIPLWTGNNGHHFVFNQGTN